VIDETKFQQLAPAGYYLGIRRGFMNPQLERNALPEDFIEIYTRNGFGQTDPLMLWCATREGSVRWLDVPEFPSSAVRNLYLAHGMEYGAAVSTGTVAKDGTRSFGFFFRSEKDFSDDELAELFEMVLASHMDAGRMALTKAQTDALRLMTLGKRHKQIAHELSISESAVKARLISAQEKLGARTATEAAVLAARLGIL